MESVNRSDFGFKPGVHRTVIKAIRFDTYNIYNIVIDLIMIHIPHMVLYHTIFMYVSYQNLWFVVVISGEEHHIPM